MMQKVIFSRKEKSVEPEDLLNQSAVILPKRQELMMMTAVSPFTPVAVGGITPVTQPMLSFSPTNPMIPFNTTHSLIAVNNQGFTNSNPEMLHVMPDSGLNIGTMDNMNGMHNSFMPNDFQTIHRIGIMNTNNISLGFHSKFMNGFSE